MRQVPTYFIIGNGKVAKHFMHYLSQLKISCAHWYRRQTTPLEATAVQSARRVILLINDDQIDPFIAAHPILHSSTLIHFSGCYQSDYAYSAHPLMVFTDNQYPITTYRSMPFVVLTAKVLDGEPLLPGLPNAVIKIPSEKQAYYHALCVMANNFTTLLWHKCFTELEHQFSIAPQQVLPFLEQTFLNLKQPSQTTLTGPLTRGDHATVQHNLSALTTDPFHEVYQAFVNVILRR